MDKDMEKNLIVGMLRIEIMGAWLKSWKNMKGSDVL